MVSVETQTASGDSVIESARGKLRAREAELEREEMRLAAEKLSTEKELELEQLRLRDHEEALQRLAEGEREEMKQKAEATLLAKTLELEATKQHLTEELELERARLRTREADNARASETALELQRQKLEAESLTATEAAIAKEQRRLQEEAEVERDRLHRKHKEVLESLEREREETRQKVEADLRETTAIHLAAEQRRLAEEGDAERGKLRDREVELARTLEHEKEMQRLRLEHEYATKQQAITNSAAVAAEQLEAERTALREREAELLRQAEHDRTVMRARVDAELRAASEATAAARAAQQSLEEERDRLEATHSEKLRAQGFEADTQLRAARAQLEEERARWEESVRYERSSDRRIWLASTVSACVLRPNALAELQKQEATNRTIEEEARERARVAREEESALRSRAELEERDAQYTATLVAKEAEFQQRIADHETYLQSVADARLQELSSQSQTLSEDLDRTRRELELQITEKHVARQSLQEKSARVEQLEAQVEHLTRLKSQPPRITTNPLDVDPMTLSPEEVPNVADSIAAFAKHFQALTFRSLLVLLGAIPRINIGKAMVLLRMYLQTHPGCTKRVDDTTGLYPLHLAAQAGLYRELTDVVLKDHPQAIRAEDRNGVYPIFYACAVRSVCDQSRIASAHRRRFGSCAGSGHHRRTAVPRESACDDRRDAASRQTPARPSPSRESGRVRAVLRRNSMCSCDFSSTAGRISSNRDDWPHHRFYRIGDGGRQLAACALAAGAAEHSHFATPASRMLPPQRRRTTLARLSSSLLRHTFICSFDHHTVAA